MKKRELGKSGIQISELTLGCMSLGKNQTHAERIIDAALDAGINHLDTADLYDFGENENVVGKAIRHKRPGIILTSKVGNDFSSGDGNYFWNPSKQHIIDGAKESLKRLQIDYLDFYMLHGGTIEDPIEDSIEAFETLKKEGWIRAYGISSIRPNVIREYVQNSSIDGVMMQYNLLDRRPEEAVLDLLLENKISVLARGPLAKGMLSNAFKNVLQKKAVSGYLDYSHEELKSITKKLSTVVPDNSMNGLAFSYVLSHPAIATAVFGASSMEQLMENAQAPISAPLSDVLQAELKNITKAVQYDQHR